MYCFHSVYDENFVYFEIYILKYLKYQMSDIRAIAFNILCQDTLGMQGGAAITGTQYEHF